jgi:hypothetical protein
MGEVLNEVEECKGCEKNRIKGVQDFERNCGVELHDYSPPAMEGKWIFDGLGNRIAVEAEKNSFWPVDDSWLPGIRDFAIFVVSKMKKPSNADNFLQGRWGPTKYFDAHYPESAFAETTPEVATWSGSDEAHYFKGKKSEGEIDELVRRKKLCVCDHCHVGRYDLCLRNASDEGLWYGKAETKRLVDKAPRNVPMLRSGTTFDQLRQWKIFHNPNSMRQDENVVAIRVHTKDRNKTEEAYYLAKVTGPVEQLKEGGMYEGNWYDRGYYVFPMQWYHYRGTAQVAGAAVGDRHYTLGLAATGQCTMQLNGVVTGVDSFNKWKKVLPRKGRDKVFTLASADHDKTMSKGNLAS